MRANPTARQLEHQLEMLGRRLQGARSQQEAARIMGQMHEVSEEMDRLEVKRPRREWKNPKGQAVADVIRGELRTLGRQSRRAGEQVETVPKSAKPYFAGKAQVMHQERRLLGTLLGMGRKQGLWRNPALAVGHHVWANPVTYQQALTASEFHAGDCTRAVGPRGGVRTHAEVWRRNGRTQTWKTRPGEFRVPVKYGMWDYGYIDNHNAYQFHVPSACPIGVNNPQLAVGHHVWDNPALAVGYHDWGAAANPRRARMMTRTCPRCKAKVGIMRGMIGGACPHCRASLRVRR